jgi:hypothetical protein
MIGKLHCDVVEQDVKTTVGVIATTVNMLIMLNLM